MAASAIRTFVVLCWLSGAAVAAAQDLTIAAASDLQFVLPPVAEQFERETGRDVRITFGSSGNFHAQIQNGAPFDLFFSADTQYPRRLEAEGRVEPGSLTEYATGRLALWIPATSGVDVHLGLPVLADPRIRRVAVANPAHAPYGRAAVAALQHEGLYERVRGKFVFGENVSQAAQFVQTGNAEAGLVALSLARAAARQTPGDVVELPATLHPAIAQAAVVLRASPHKEAARQFLTFLKRPEAIRAFREAGFSVPEAAPALRHDR